MLYYIHGKNVSISHLGRKILYVEKGDWLLKVYWVEKVDRSFKPFVVIWYKNLNLKYFEMDVWILVIILIRVVTVEDVDW